MPRTAYLEGHLSNEELKQRYRASQDAVESRRYHLLWLVSQGHSIKRASEMVTLSYRYARYVVKDYNQQSAYEGTSARSGVLKVLLRCSAKHSCKNYGRR